MSVTYGFYNSLAGDRKYDAVQMSSIFDGVITDGVFAGYGDGLIVLQNPTPGMSVLVGTGRAWFNHTWTLSDAPSILSIDAAEVVLHRIDAIVLEVDSSAAVRANSIKVVKGTPASDPVAPTMVHTGTKNQYPLAFVRVNSGITSILNSMITNNIGQPTCPIVVGALATINVADLLTQWEAEFDIWLTNLQNQLTENQATNLQNQINALIAQENGWFPSGDTWSFVSADAATAVINANSDKTGKIQKGYRVKYTQLQALTAGWNLDANSNSQVGAFNGTDTAITYAAGKFGNAAGFNGTTSKITIADNAALKPTGDFTLGLWFKTSVTGSAKTLFQSYSQNTNHAGIDLYITAANVLQMYIGKNTGTVVNIDAIAINGTINVCDNAWHYVVVTVKENIVQIYVDGKLDVSGYSFSPVYAATNYIRIGCGNSIGTDQVFMNGQIDDVFLINGYAIDEQTIRAKFNAQSAQGTGSISITKYGIVTNVGSYSGGNTPITIWGGTDFSTANSTITNPYYSSSRAPFGFNFNPDKWMVLYQTFATASQASPPANTVYNLAGALTIPIGLWKVRGDAYFSVNVSAPLRVGVNYGLSLVSNSSAVIEKESQGLLTGYTTDLLATLLKPQFQISLSIKKTVYFNLWSGANVPASISVSGSILRADSLYL